MATAGPGYVLRNQVGGFPPLVAPAAIPAAEPSEIGGDCNITAPHAQDRTPGFVPLVHGTRRQLVACGLFPFDPGPGSSRGEFPIGNYAYSEAPSGYPYVCLEPTPPWGTPGRLVRTPRTVVVTCAAPLNRDLFADVLEYLDTNYSEFAERRISIYGAEVPFRITPRDFDDPTAKLIAMAPGYNAFALPAIVTGTSYAEGFVNDGEVGSPNRYTTGEVITHDPRLVGGETLYVCLDSGSGLGAVGRIATFSLTQPSSGFSRSGLSILGAATQYFFDSGSSSGWVSGYVLQQQLAANSSAMVTAANRFSRLGLVLGNVQWSGIDAEVYAANGAGLTQAAALYPPGTGVSAANYGSTADEIGASIVDTIRSFFG